MTADVKRQMNRFRGNFPATIDPKGRLKIPTAFKQHLEENYGPEVYVTSLSGQNILVYPMSIWEEKERKISEKSHFDPQVRKLKQITSLFGQGGMMDSQGRVLVPSTLRDYHGELIGEVAVLGNYDHLEVWKLDQILSRTRESPLTDDDFKALAELGL